MLPPPPKVPKTGKGKEDLVDGKGRSSPSAAWMAGQAGHKPASGWKNYMVPLLGVSCPLIIMIGAHEAAC